MSIDSEDKLKELQDVLADSGNPVMRGQRTTKTTNRKTPRTIGELLARSREIYARYNASRRPSE